MYFEVGIIFLSRTNFSKTPLTMLVPSCLKSKYQSWCLVFVKSLKQNYVLLALLHAKR